MKKRDIRVRVSTEEIRKLQQCQEGIKNAARSLLELADQPCPGFKGQPKLHLSYLRAEIRKRAEWWNGFIELQEVIDTCLANLNKRKEDSDG